MKLASRLFLGIAPFVLIFACFPKDQSTSQTQFSVRRDAAFNKNLKVLRKMQSLQTVRICITGDEPNANTSSGDSLRDSDLEQQIFIEEANALRLWADALTGNAYWPAGERKFEFNCGANNFDMTVVRYTDKRYGSAVQEKQVIRISDWGVESKAFKNFLRFEKKRTDKEIEEAFAAQRGVTQTDIERWLPDALRGTLTHESGHILGLGDTYQRYGYIDDPGNQPSSMMNGGTKHGPGFGLSDDDKVSINVLVNHVFGKQPLVCPSGYEEHQTSGERGSSSNLICSKIY